MTEKELRRLDRNDLLQMLLEQSRQLEDMKHKYAEAEAALQQRRIAIEESGSIAEASLRLNGVFEAAQAACEQYTENMASLSRQTEAECAKMEAESRERAQQIVADAAARSEEMLRSAKEQSEQYWNAVHAKLQAFTKEHEELRSLLAVLERK